MTSHPARPVYLCFCLLLSAGVSTDSLAQSNSNPVEVLKACALEQIPRERNKDKPKFDSIKKACEQEYDDLLAVVHPKVANAYRKLIREDIEKELKKKD